MIKTIEQLKEQAKKINLLFYSVHNCSMCGYHCGYIIKGAVVAYDNGCHCTGKWVVEERDWEDLTESYNMNQPENNPDIKGNFLKELNEIWKFKDI